MCWVVAHKVVSHDEWVAARKRHLGKEKELTHLRDQLSRERRELPWELVDKDYTFDDYGPAYAYGYDAYAKYPGKRFDDVVALTDASLVVRPGELSHAQR